MFTGIITDLGKVKSITFDEGAAQLHISTAYEVNSIALGASIACNGICLTVTDTDEDSFAVTASTETLAATTLGNWKTGQAINLERALRMGDELGGHLVSGHVDGLASILSITPCDVSHQLTLEVPHSLKHYLARKGSVALDGISLTVNAVNDNQFDVNIIPHTWQYTHLKDRKTGDKMNIEIDLFARYIERQMERS